MPAFKTTHNIIHDPSHDELWEDKWLNTNTPYEPPTSEWDYKRELKINDVDIWECVWEGDGGRGVYASWKPYAEFYMIRTGWFNQHRKVNVETYYGPGSQSLVIKRMIELGYPVSMFDVWIDNDKQWLYHDPDEENIHYSVGDGSQQMIMDNVADINLAILETHKH